MSHEWHVRVPTRGVSCKAHSFFLSAGVIRGQGVPLYKYEIGGHSTSSLTSNFNVCIDICVSWSVTLSNSRRVLIPSTVERQGRGSTPLYVAVYGVEGDVAGQVQQDFYVFARSPLFRSLYRYLYSFFVEVSHITLTTGHLLQSMTTGLPFVMQGGLE